jgi:glycosyltransferase involved in cell wall biosynthesis
MRLAILGTRGIPACYGGFETFAEELSARLAAGGHEVTVYSRAHLTPAAVREHRGAAVRRLPALRTKSLETLSHTLLSCLDASRRRFDVVLLCNAANAPLLPILRMKRLPVALNVDGLERKRRKWGALGRAYYRAGEALAARWAGVVVTDAAVIQRYYRRAWGRDSIMIPYGGDLPAPDGDATLRALGLHDDGYLLYVSRFEPENNPDRIAAEYRNVGGQVPLVMVGGAPYAKALTQKVQALASADPRIILTGPLYGDRYRELLFHARAYIHATEVGGTHPALVEAMGAGRLVLFLDNAANREVVGDAGIPFLFDGVSAFAPTLGACLAEPARSASLGAAARARVMERYRWDDVAAAYERLLEGLCSANRQG